MGQKSVRSKEISSSARAEAEVLTGDVKGEAKPKQRATFFGQHSFKNRLSANDPFKSPQDPSTCHHSESRYCIHPESSRLFWWQCLIIVLVLESAAEVPYAVGFDQQPLPLGPMILVELVFMADVCLNFFIGYVDSFTQDTIMDLTRSSTRYLRSFFIVDVAASLPTETIALVLNSSNNVRAIKGLRIIKIFRLIRLLRLDPSKYFEGSTFISPGVMRLFKLMASGLIIYHLLSFCPTL
jgi:hypothetical protein